MKPPESLRALLANSIDYAGLFPPATLELEPALKNFADYIRSDDAWMLSTFVLPIAKFAEATLFAFGFSEKYPLRISALGPKTMNEPDFAEQLNNVEKGIRELSIENAKVMRVEQLEMPLPAALNREAFSALRDIPVRSFWEAPAIDAEKTTELLAECNATTGTTPVGFKLRTGGVTADAFPSSAQVARALVAAAKHKVPIKFTAGLHHPVRLFRDEVKTKMHGFINVLGAGVLAIEHKWNEEKTAAMLDDEDASAFMFNDEAFTWRDSKIASAKIVEHRKMITSLGSCSFDEPRDDLRALSLL